MKRNLQHYSEMPHTAFPILLKLHEYCITFSLTSLLKCWFLNILVDIKAKQIVCKIWRCMTQALLQEFQNGFLCLSHNTQFLTFNIISLKPLHKSKSDIWNFSVWKFLFYFQWETLIHIYSTCHSIFDTSKPSDSLKMSNQK